MKILRIALLAVTACALTACFDLDQKIAIGRDGSGSYQVSLAAEGALGDAMKNDKSKKSGDMLDSDKAVVTTEFRNGKVVKTARVDFKSLSELPLHDEEASLTVLDRGWFGFGPAHVRFRRTFMIGSARAARGGDSGTDEAGKAAVAAIFGGHTYSFSVTLPGSIERIAPVKINGVEIKPEVSGDSYNGHTIVWRMPLAMLMEANKLTFETDFSAFSSFENAKTRASKT
jgi:hypothetical protein